MSNIGLTLVFALGIAGALAFLVRDVITHLRGSGLVLLLGLGDPVPLGERMLGEGDIAPARERRRPAHRPRRRRPAGLRHDPDRGGAAGEPPPGPDLDQPGRPDRCCCTP